MDKLELNKAIAVAKEARKALKLDCGTSLKVEYKLAHREILCIEVDAKAAYLGLDGRRISKAELIKALN